MVVFQCFTKLRTEGVLMTGRELALGHVAELGRKALHPHPLPLPLSPAPPPPPLPAIAGGRWDSGTQRRTSRSCTAMRARQCGVLRSPLPPPWSCTYSSSSFLLTCAVARGRGGVWSLARRETEGAGRWSRDRRPYSTMWRGGTAPGRWPDNHLSFQPGLASTPPQPWCLSGPACAAASAGCHMARCGGCR